MQALQKKYYGYHTAVIDLRNPTRSDGDNMLHLVNKYMDEYLADHTDLSAKAKSGKICKDYGKDHYLLRWYGQFQLWTECIFSMMRQKAC